MEHRGIRVFAWLLICGFLFACRSVPAPSQPVPTETAPAVTASPTSAPTSAPTPTPTVTPTPTATPTPTPTPTPEPITEERLSAGEFDGYFDDAVIIGDSLTQGFSFYVRKLHSMGINALGEVKFMGASAMSVKNASTDQTYSDINFSYRGQSVSITEGINVMGAKKAFILLGLNDISCRRWEDVEQYFADLIEVLQQKCPETQIVIQGVFPVTYTFCRDRAIRIEEWNSFNEILGRVCADRHVELYDFGAMFMDESGYMKADYGDGGFHLSEDGDAVWLKALRIYAARQMCPGAELLPTPAPTQAPTPTPTLTPEPSPPKGGNVAVAP